MLKLTRLAKPIVLTLVINHTCRTLRKTFEKGFMFVAIATVLDGDSQKELNIEDGTQVLGTLVHDHYMM